MDYLRDGWYMVAWASDLPSVGVLPAQVMNERIVIYRGASGKLVGR